MRWSIVGVIFFREMRDQLRDRRTIFMVVVLPLMIYPFLGMGVVQFALGTADKPSVIGVVGSENLPVYQPLSNTAWLTLTPSGPGSGIGLDRLLGAAAWGYVEFRQPRFPALIIQDHFNDIYFDSAPEKRYVQLQILPAEDPSLLESKQIDLLMIVPADFQARLENDQRPSLELKYRENDERSRSAANRVYAVLRNYKKHLREIRLVRKQLPADFDDPFQVRDAEREKSTDRVVAEGLLDLLVRIFPFFLVMWSMAGALYPAVDICAGEKERGTMETLLISPASREEIVWGKFLTIWLFSTASALLNLASMGITSSLFGGIMPQGALPASAFFWCVLLALPLTAFFSAICLAVGAYARSTKEGQYYLMPLFFITMPLVFLTLAPGVELNPFYSMVPVTGIALLTQRLMTSTLEKVPWMYFVPVLAPMGLYSWLALRWAIEQFHREEVLFREAERLDLPLWLKGLFRDKEALPSAGQAAFCFALILVFRWLFSQVGLDGALVVRTGIVYLAFVAAPALFMAIILTKRPRESLLVLLPAARTMVVAILLAALLFSPLTALAREFIDSPVVQKLLAFSKESSVPWGPFLLVFGLIAAVSEELAFRGFILQGLRRRLPLWTAILVNSLLYALYHLNVFQAVPAMFLGFILALLTVWSNSAIPAMVLHLMYNCLILGPGLWDGIESENATSSLLFSPPCAIGCGAVAVGLLGYMGRELFQRKNKDKQLDQ